MRTPAKVAIALTLSIGVLGTSAVVAAAGSDTETHRATGGVFMDPTGGSSDPSTGSSGGAGGSVPGDPGDGSSGGPIAIDPVDPGPCGQTVTSGTGPDGTVSYTPCPGDDPSFPTPVPTPIEPTPGMEGVHSRSWDSFSASGGGSSVTLTYYTGVAPCSVLDHIDVKYGTEAVTITLFEGSDPSSKDTACIDIAMLVSTTVTLDQPLGDRQIVDGAA